MTDHPTTEARLRTADDWLNEEYAFVAPKFASAFRAGWAAHACEVAALQEPLDVPRLTDRGVLEQACIAVVGPWFDESSERGRFAPIELAQRILREYDARLREGEPR